ncbi:MAG: 3'-5' exonuclease [Acidimicrobiia bacterium]
MTPPPAPIGPGPLIALDLETTGLDPRHDVILSFGTVPIVDGMVRMDRSTYRVMRSSKPVGVDVVRIHQLRPADLAVASPRADTLYEFERILGDHPLVVWSAWVETSFLAATLGGRRRRWERRMIDVRDLVKELDSRLGRPRDPHETLSACAVRYGIPPGVPHHALADAFVTAQLFVVTRTMLSGPPRVRRSRQHRARIL